MQALKQIGYDAFQVKTNLHKFGYPKQAGIMHPRFMLKEAMLADVVFFTHTNIKLFIEFKHHLRDKPLVQFHGGSVYRQNPERCNRLFNKRVAATVIVTGDLLDLGAKRQVYVRQPVDVDAIKPIWDDTEYRKIRVMHNPSLMSAKGTNDIVSVLVKLHNKYPDKLEVHLNKNPVPWWENIKRMRNCDIYIDQMQMMQKDKVLGDWGNASLEATALGKIVLSSHVAHAKYKQHYGFDCPIIPVNSKQQLEDSLTSLIHEDDATLNYLKHSMREWVVKYHSFEATAKRIQKLVIKNL